MAGCQYVTENVGQIVVREFKMPTSLKLKKELQIKFWSSFFALSELQGGETKFGSAEGKHTIQLILGLD